MPVPLLGQAKDKEPDVIEASTAFLIVINKDNSVLMVPDINSAVTVERPPSMQEVKMASHTVYTDIDNQEVAILSAQHVINAQMQLGQQLAEARHNQQIMGSLPKMAA